MPMHLMIVVLRNVQAESPTVRVFASGAPVYTQDVLQIRMHPIHSPMPHLVGLRKTVLQLTVLLLTIALLLCTSHLAKVRTCLFMYRMVARVSRLEQLDLEVTLFHPLLQ